MIRRSMPGRLFWILSPDGEPQAETMEGWLAWTQRPETLETLRVALTEVGPYQVSTVFLSVDASLADPPKLFETMVFHEDGIYPEDTPYQVRYATRAEAEAAHQAAVAWVQQHLKEGSPRRSADRVGGEEAP